MHKNFRYILLYFKAVQTSRMGQQYIVSKMMKSMPHVAARVFDKYIVEEITDKKQYKVTYNLILFQTPSTGMYSVQ